MRCRPVSVAVAMACSVTAGACGSSSRVVAPSAPPPGEHVGHAPAGAAAMESIATLQEGAQLFEGYGSYHRAITTVNPQAQVWFDQGLRMLYAFHHDEAARSFARGATIDPSCAMCFWGIAYALGPNYNVPMLSDRFALAWDALGKARAFAHRCTAAEQALIGALAARYKGPHPHDAVAQEPLNHIYAASMRSVARRFPDDLDVQVLAAEALMDVRPWKLWSRHGAPAPGTLQIVQLLETVLAKEPSHPGANHYYIHAVEASPDPARALPSAERLPSLMPAAGHILHMPAHIYQRIGRYADASAANRAAIDADLAYLRRTRPIGYYPMYLGHNYGFLAYSASMEGRAAESLEAARASARALPPSMLAMMPGMDFFVSAPLLVMVRFSMWDRLLDEPKPDPSYHAMTGLWLHAHGMAAASTGRIYLARDDLRELQQLIHEVPAEEQASNNSTRALLRVGAKALEARIAEQQQAPEALQLWAEAVALEDQLAYAEPADWFYPLRHFQGAALLEAGRPREAEEVYRADLERHPRNGWALSGLHAALEAQDRLDEAEQVQDELDRAWSHADVPPITAGR